MHAMKTTRAAVFAALATASGLALAGATAQEIDRLGKDLTPVGAEKAGNKEGTIPAWTGGYTTPIPGDKPGGRRGDPFKDEKPLYSINAKNADQYAGKLTDGTKAMLKKHPDFKITVYPTRRSAALPQEQYENIRKAAANAKLVPSGNGFTGGGNSTIPFPVPKVAEEILWNHNLRWKGGSIEREASWYNVQPNGSNFRVAFSDRFVSESGGFLDVKRDNIYQDFIAYYRLPATLEGTIYLVWDPIDQDKEARSGWIYNSGQRRVRRVPELCCDFTADGTEGLRFADQYDAWNGTTDRYTWKLVGKKEMIIPYNNYKLTDKSLKTGDVLKPGAVNPDLVRNELHRVWVVEGTLKPGARHVIAKRTMYFDEDTFQNAAADLYDSRGELWRYQETYTMQYYDALVPFYSGITYYDLNSGAYELSFATFEDRGAPVFGKHQKLSDYQPDALRRMGSK